MEEQKEKTVEKRRSIGCEIALEIYGRVYNMTDLTPQMNCTCGRPPGECPDIYLTDLAHCCFDAGNTWGNPHKHKSSGKSYVEVHFNWCYGIESHFEDGTWDQWPKFDGSYYTVKDYGEYILNQAKQSAQWAASGEVEDKPVQHDYIQLKAAEIAKLDPEVVVAHANHLGISVEEQLMRVYDLLGMVQAVRATARAQTSLRHGVIDKTASRTMIRWWPGEEKRLHDLDKATYQSIRLVRDGVVQELETSSLPALFAFMGLPGLPERVPKFLTPPRQPAELEQK